LSLVLVAPGAWADVPPGTPPPAAPPPASLPALAARASLAADRAREEQLKLKMLLQLERGRTMRTVGIVLTVVGALAAVGAVLSFASIRNRCPDQPDGCWDNLDNLANVLAGSLTAAIAIGGLGAGVSLWVVGERRMAGARRALANQAALLPYLAPQPGGLVAGLRALSF
jgi:hypothetical protein